MTDLDFTGMTPEQMNVRSIDELMEPLHRYGDPPSHELTPEQKTATVDFMRAAHVGKYLLGEVVWHADDQDNVEFFKCAFDLYGSLIDVLLQEMDLPPRQPDGTRDPETREPHHRPVGLNREKEA